MHNSARLFIFNLCVLRLRMAFVKVSYFLQDVPSHDTQVHTYIFTFWLLAILLSLTEVELRVEFILHTGMITSHVARQMIVLCASASCRACDLCTLCAQQMAYTVLASGACMYVPMQSRYLSKSLLLGTLARTSCVSTCRLGTHTRTSYILMASQNKRNPSVVSKKRHHKTTPLESFFLREIMLSWHNLTFPYDGGSNSSS